MALDAFTIDTHVPFLERSADLVVHKNVWQQEKHETVTMIISGCYACVGNILFKLKRLREWKGGGRLGLEYNNFD